MRHERDGRAHIYGVTGPDEYHEPVDDNAFTNVLAPLEPAAGGDAVGHDEHERETWLAVAEVLVDGYDQVSGIYEQFAGFSELEPLVIEEVAPRRPIAADLLLGAERTAGAQVLKQADVLMLHHLLPDEGTRLARPQPRLLRAAHRSAARERQRHSNLLIRGTPHCKACTEYPR